MPRTAVIVACLVACIVISSGAAGQASAGDAMPSRIVWMWVDKYGTLSFTDDEKRIPAAYRADAGRKAVDWPRVTVDQVGIDERREALSARLKALRTSTPTGCRCTR